MIILESIVGSRGMGINTPSSDIDFMAVKIEGQEELFPLTGTPFEARVTTNPDKQIYGLHKFLRLCMQGNPSILGMLFIKPNYVGPIGAQLLDLRPKLVSRRAGSAFMGYLDDQYKRLKGERGQKRVNRPDLVEQFGWDTKYGMHVVRLALHGIELLETGFMSFPMLPDHRQLLKDIRNGQLTLEETVELADTLIMNLERAKTETSLPPAPDYKYVQEWLNDSYLDYWVK